MVDEKDIRDTESYRLGRAIALLEQLLDTQGDAAARKRRRQRAREFLAEEATRSADVKRAWEKHLREREGAPDA